MRAALGEAEALTEEYLGGIKVVQKEGTKGARKFRDGKGRKGDFDNVNVE